MKNTFGPRFWSGLSYIIFVALFMTLFELLFFVLFLAPSETKHANEYIKNFTGGGDLLSLVNNEKIDKANAMINVMKERESKLNKTINENAILAINLEIILFILLIFIFLFLIKNSNIKGVIGFSEFWNNFSTSITPSLFSAFICALILILFQISMYFFGKKYSYPGNKELKYKIVTKFKKDLDL